MIQQSHSQPSLSVSQSHSVVSDSLRPHGLQPTWLLCPWRSPGKTTGVGCHSLLQRIFPTHGSNSVLLHCRQILYRLSHQGSPTLRHISGQIYNSKSTCTPMFIAALFTIAKTCKQLRCPSTDERIKKMWYIYTVEYYSAIKRTR